MCSACADDANLMVTGIDVQGKARTGDVGLANRHSKQERRGSSERIHVGFAILKVE